MHTYSEKFYDDQSAGSLKSAKSVVPIVVRCIKPSSVVDVGCGIGTWLSVFLEHGVQEIQGIDGPYVDSKKLLIPIEYFQAANLSTFEPPRRRFDLAVCLEVAEHLSSELSDEFIKKLTSLSDLILFSGAIPFQGGEHHINEQWPQYWSNKFQKNDFIAYDIFRHHFWNDENVDFWYRQNLILYARKGKTPALDGLEKLNINHPESLVHPQQYLQKCNELKTLQDEKFSTDRLIDSLRYRIEDLKDPAMHSPWNSFIFLLNTIFKGKLGKKTPN